MAGVAFGGTVLAQDTASQSTAPAAAKSTADQAAAPKATKHHKGHKHKAADSSTANPASASSSGK
ncbi:hypothetical protein BV497_12020 [Fulvimonas soli]|nr:hypothetical protein BV497_12020 [Fulvimonas soli]